MFCELINHLAYLFVCRVKRVSFLKSPVQMALSLCLIGCIWGCDDSSPSKQYEGQMGGDQGEEVGSGGVSGGDFGGDSQNEQGGTLGGMEEGGSQSRQPEPLDLACNTAVPQNLNRDQLETLKWDDGQGVATLLEQEWAIDGRVLNQEDLFEAVRFELKHPARIHAIRVQYGALGRFVSSPLHLGLYGDFGYNGFDFWSKSALWQGSRCSGDTEVGQWITFQVDPPLEVTHPGLIYVAQHREYSDDPAFLFDGTPPKNCDPNTENCCEPFDGCRSSWTLPKVKEVQGTSFWGGFATSFQFDYLVRLEVEYTDDVDPQNKVFLPQTEPELGGRYAWGDFDDDGDEDLLTSGPRLYRNDDGQWTDITEMSGLEGSAGSGGVWGDYNNDGCLDLFLFEESSVGSDTLMQGRCDGTFEDQTEFAQIQDILSEQRCGEAQDGQETDRAPTAAAAWADLDGDGFLDLYLANFLCWSSGEAYMDQIWHNEGDGTFSEWTGLYGFAGPNDSRWATRGVSPIDYQIDGDIDIFANAYRLNPNRFYVNTENAYSEQANELSLSGNPVPQGIYDYFGHSIGVAWGDLNEDGRFDLVVANLAHPRFFDFSDKTEILIQQEDGHFEDIQGDWQTPQSQTGLRYQETHSVPVLGDFNQDGHLDLVITAVYDGRPTDFYWGQGDGTFELDQYHSGIEATGAWGISSVDYDQDGDLDLVLQGQLHQNQGRNLGHALQVKLVGDQNSNWAGIGSTILLYSGDRVWMRSIEGGSAQGNQNSMVAHFGLGDLTVVDRIEVQWIGGQRAIYEGPFDSDQRLKIFESGQVVSF